MEQFKCPRCNGIEFSEYDCGPDGYDDDITWTSCKCKGCQLWYSGWTDKWYTDVDSWPEEEDGTEYETA
jgi:hypothetical protein